ncbi:hypothetical protein Tcan_08808 [Toxocara canis]|uniref:Uncharacterized protein n=1 Tax=Toxocara canis TaxID=6265 RepID=A0A0B2URU6_TOXCA|nr:hypothetical protein Tcan_08808 [Toxocara canis]
MTINEAPTLSLSPNGLQATEVMCECIGKTPPSPGEPEPLTSLLKAFTSTSTQVSPRRLRQRHSSYNLRK